MRSSICQYIFDGLDPTEVFGEKFYINEISMIVLEAMFEIGFLRHELFADSYVNLTKGQPCMFNQKETVKLARVLSEIAEQIKETKEYQIIFRIDNKHYTVLKDEHMQWITVNELEEFIDFINCSGGFFMTNTGNIEKEYEFAGYCPVTKNKSWKPEITKQTNSIQREKTKELEVD